MSYTTWLKRLLGSWTQFQSVYWDGLPHKLSNSLASVGCLKIQLSSDTIYLEKASDSTSKWFSPTSKLTHPSYFWLTGYISEVPTIFSLSLIRFLGQFTEVRNTFYLLGYPFRIIIVYNSVTARWKRRTG